MRLPHPLFGMSPLRDLWEVAGGPTRFPADYRDALSGLSKNRDLLPAPVFFEVPDGATESDEDWAALVSASHPYCRCASRRILVPARGRSRFISNTPPQLVTLQYQYDQTIGHFPDTYNSEVLLVAPHGGDQASAYLSAAFHYADLLVGQLPYAAEQHHNVRLIRDSASLWRGGVNRFTWSQTWDRLDYSLTRDGDIVFFQDLRGSYGRRTVPTFAIIERGALPEVSSRGPRPNVVIEVDAGARVITNPDYAMPPHVCKNDVEKQED